MKKAFIISATLIAVLFLSVGFLGGSNVAMAQDKDAACNALGGCDKQGVTVENTVRTVIQILSYFVGVVAVVMIIIGGFLYLTSGGDSNRVASAKNTIIYAIVGLVIALLAQALVRFVFAKTTTPPVTSDKKESSLIDPGTIDSIRV